MHARVDPRLIKQAILNLILNGMQAMGAAGGDLIVQLSATPLEALIEVIDTGKGMTPDVKQKLFQAYFSLRKEAPASDSPWPSESSTNTTAPSPCLATRARLQFPGPPAAAARR